MLDKKISDSRCEEFQFEYKITIVTSYPDHK